MHSMNDGIRPVLRVTYIMTGARKVLKKIKAWFTRRCNGLFP